MFKSLLDAWRGVFDKHPNVKSTVHSLSNCHHLRGFFFHKTALVFVPLYWLLQWRFSQVFVCAAGISAFCVATFMPQVFEWVGTAIFDKGEYFSGGANEAFFKGRIYYMEFLITGLLAVLTMLAESRSPDVFKDCRSLVNMVYVAFLTACCSVQIPNAERFILYFTPVYIVLIPPFVRCVWRGPAGVLVLMLLVCVFGGRLVYDTYVLGDANGVLPYTTVFQRDSVRKVEPLEG